MRRLGKAMIAMVRVSVAAWCGVLFAIACSGGSSGNGPTGGASLYTSSCEQACQNEVVCGGLAAAEQAACVTDCNTEPWPGNYRQCRATTCGLTEGQCEVYGVMTCEQACQKLVSCGTQAQSEYDACVADCRTEPWAGNYIDCRATLCGATEGQCETFHGT
jgi:hypothetical protein